MYGHLAANNLNRILHSMGKCALWSSKCGIVRFARLLIHPINPILLDIAYRVTEDAKYQITEPTNVQSRLTKWCYCFANEDWPAFEHVHCAFGCALLSPAPIHGFSTAETVAHKSFSDFVWFSFMFCCTRDTVLPSIDADRERWSEPSAGSWNTYCSSSVCRTQCPMELMIYNTSTINNTKTFEPVLAHMLFVLYIWISFYWECFIMSFAMQVQITDGKVFRTAHKLTHGDGKLSDVGITQRTGTNAMRIRGTHQLEIDIFRCCEARTIRRRLGWFFLWAALGESWSFFAYCKWTIQITCVGDCIWDYLTQPNVW